ncbi:META domain-containing protein [Pseudodesulfovibrio sediminis]|uniref:DUF306 domain-containing protein n=1 Tax=Pseudodesulfovibrio sediminis TaxID=2810563 RepID=A0ABN6EY29_9BACT|nr:META domain-containing protein [Pseudodesulfovibrio sediminis]BCS90100.1 hypothetical protein PSDVSF_33420 [Pseudodesulfovibrio sediminis]
MSAVKRKVCPALLVTVLLLAGCMGSGTATTVDIKTQLVDREWVAESILGDPVVDMSHTSISFTDKGAVQGSGGCNRFSGSYILNGDVLSFGPMSATMMACVPPLGDQEMRFFRALASPLKVKIENGLLYLVADDGRELIFAVQD